MKVTSVWLDDQVLSRIDGLASESKRSRDWIIQQAVEHYLEYEEWFKRQVTAGVEAVEDGKTMPHDRVMGEIRRKIDRRLR